MSENSNLKQCSRCHSNIFLYFFEKNRKGELYKTCNSCRDINRNANKKYRENNTEKENERKQQYRIDNIDKVREYDRQRDAIRQKEIIQCECGASICYGYKAKHRQTKKHQELIANNNL
jgi:hypothetical protein